MFFLFLIGGQIGAGIGSVVSKKTVRVLSYQSWVLKRIAAQRVG
jgi:hypothetical protein